MNSTSFDNSLDKLIGSATMPPEIFRWWFYPINGGSMNKVNQFIFYEFGAALVSLRNIKSGGTMADAIVPLVHAGVALRNFTVQTQDIPMKLSKTAAHSLLEIVSATIRGEKDKETDWEAKLKDDTLKKILRKLDEFEAVFSIEAAGLNVYAVSQTAGYSTDTLIQRGEEVIPEEIREHLSDYSKNEMREAGRCLVFNLPTAAGFHMLRSMESVLRETFDVLSDGAPRPKTSQGDDVPMGAYIGEIERLGATREAIEVLRQIKNLHRNPHMHPDAVLSMPEAIVLLGIVVSAVSIMADEMLKKKGEPPIVTPPASPSSTSGSTP